MIFEFNVYLHIIIIITLINIIYLEFTKNEVNIYIGNSFKTYYELPINPLFCIKRNKLYKCRFSSEKKFIYNSSIYNGNRKFPSKTNMSYNIIMTIEKLSQVKFMENIGKGNNSNYQLAVDYRLFNNKWHISYPIYSDYNLDEFIHFAKSNFNSISHFLKRKNVVYIQRSRYPNRQYLVKEFMKYISVDSYGRDLNNKDWPKNISKKNKVELVKNYKFCIAIENSVITWKNGTKYEAPHINDDYVTEKLTDCLVAGSIPIYFGPHNIDLFLPHPTSIINFRDYNSIKSLTDYIRIVMNNTTLIEYHLQWHKNISKDWYIRFNRTYSFNYCKICNFVKK